MSRFNVSVIVINYNCISTLQSCIGSILCSDLVAELLLIDNASTDSSMNLTAKYDDFRLKILRLKTNIGLAAARNMAAAKAQGNYLAFTDADIAVDSQWLNYPCLLLERHKEFGAVQCNILRCENIDEIPFSATRVCTSKEDDRSKEKPNSFYDIPFPVGAGFVMRREVWNLVKGFDPCFFIGNDDVDFGIRLLISGFDVVASLEGTIYHKFGTLRSKKEISPIFQFYGFRNMLFIWSKNLQGKTIVKHVLPFALLFPFMAARFGGFLGVKGMFSFLKNLPLILKSRYEVQKIRRTSDEEIIPRMQSSGTLPIQLLINDIHMLFAYFK